MISSLRTSFELLRLAWRQDRPKTLLALVLMLLHGLTTPLMALSLKWLTEDAAAGEISSAVFNGSLVAVLLIASLTLSHFAHVPFFELSELNVLAMQEQAIQLANGSAGMGHLEDPERADDIAVLEQEIGQMNTCLDTVLSVLDLAVAMVVTVVLLAFVDPVLLVLLAAAVPPLMIGRRATARLDRERLRNAEPRRRALRLFHLATSAAPAKELRVLGLAGELRARHRADWSRWSGALAREEWRSALVTGAAQLIFAVAYCGAVLYVLREALQGRRTPGDLVLTVILAAQVSQQVATAQTLFVQLHRLGHIFQRYERLRSAVAAPERDNAADPPQRLTDGVRIEGVTFRYADAPQPVLSNVDLTLPAGWTVAIVGENGAGKTTLVKLLCRFYEPERGRILVDGVDLNQFAAEAWRARISACFQDFARFEFRIREGVGFGDLPRLDEDDVLLGALQHADARDMVAKLPGGLETSLGRSHGEGSELSGGQWQKVALSRSMMREAPLLLILDEPASALDAEAEHALFERYVANARRLARDTGTITIFTSHRFSTVRKADMIIVVGDGGILDVGSHEVLMAREGLYADLFKLQAEAYA